MDEIIVEWMNLWMSLFVNELKKCNWACCAWKKSSKVCSAYLDYMQQDLKTLTSTYSNTFAYFLYLTWFKIGSYQNT